jgi:hypothetical protein
MFASDVTPERKKELFTKLVNKIVELRLTPVAIVTLESVKPLTFIGSQVMVFFQPIFMAVFPFKQYEELGALLEERSNVEDFIVMLEHAEDDFENQKRTAKEARRAAAKAERAAADARR